MGGVCSSTTAVAVVPGSPSEDEGVKAAPFSEAQSPSASDGDGLVSDAQPSGDGSGGEVDEATEASSVSLEMSEAKAASNMSRTTSSGNKTTSLTTVVGSKKSVQVMADGCTLRCFGTGSVKFTKTFLVPFYYEALVVFLPPTATVVVGSVEIKASSPTPSHSSGTSVAMGASVSVKGLPGKEPRSWGWFSTGDVFGSSRSHASTMPFGTGDIIGVGLSDDKMFMTKNGKKQELFLPPVSVVSHVPCVGFDGAGTLVSVNFGSRPFRYQAAGSKDATAAEDERSPMILSKRADSCGRVLVDRLTVRYDVKAGTIAKKLSGLIQANRPLRQGRGIAYFEVLLIECSMKKDDSTTVVGVTQKRHPPTAPPGQELPSVGLHVQSGSLVVLAPIITVSATYQVPPASGGDIIGCGLNFLHNQCFFTRNGTLLGSFDAMLQGAQWLPSVFIGALGETVSLNFGHLPFCYDLRTLFHAELRRDGSLPGVDISTTYTPTSSNVRRQSLDAEAGENDSPTSKLESKPSTLIGPWTKDKLLGRGAFGVVYLAIENESGRRMAAKQIQLIDDDQNDSQIDLEEQRKCAQSLEHEIQMLKSLSHANIVNYLGCERSSSTITILMEYAPVGSLASLLGRRDRRPLPEPVIARFVRQILEGLQFLHAQKMVHRDIKSHNVLVAWDPPPPETESELAAAAANNEELLAHATMKIADFGTATRVEAVSTVAGGTTALATTIGTPAWMAPEVLKDEGYGRKADIWSLGCVMMEMCTGHPPWHPLAQPLAVIYKIAMTDEMPAMPQGVSDVAVSFLHLCLRRTPAERPTCSELLRHPFVSRV